MRGLSTYYVILISSDYLILIRSIIRVFAAIIYFKRFKFSHLLSTIYLNINVLGFINLTRFARKKT